MNNPRISIEAIRMWLLATVFSFFQFFLQIMTNVMTDPLMKSFDIAPLKIGLLSSAFFYPFIAVQIPAGYLLKKYSYKTVLILAIIFCSFGLGLFAISQTYLIAVLGRAIAGIGAGFGFLGMLTITHLWFSSKYFSLMVGLSEFIAMTLTAGSEKLLAQSVITHGWRHASLFVCLALLILAIFMLLGLKQKNSEENASNISFCKALIVVLKTSGCWVSGLFGFGLFSIVTAFSALWGFQFLTIRYEYTSAQASLGISAVFLGLALGCPAIGVMVARYQRQTLLMKITSVLSLIFSTVLIFPITQYPITLVYGGLFLIGFCCASYYLCYEVSANFIETQYRGVAMAFSSMCVMLGAVILQPLMGYIIEWWTRVLPNSQIAPIQAALCLLLMAQLCAVIAAFIPIAFEF
jgi:MFS family permease